MSQLVLETINKQVEDEFQGESGEDAATEVETVKNKDTAENEVAEEIVNIEEVNDKFIDCAEDTRHNLNDEHQKIAERLNEIRFEGETSDGNRQKYIECSNR